MSLDELIKIKNIQGTFGVLLLLFPTQMAYIMSFKSMLDVFMKENNTDPLYDDLRTAHNFLERKLTELNFNPPPPNAPHTASEGPPIPAYPTFDEEQYYDSQLLEKYEELRANAIRNGNSAEKEFYARLVKNMKERLRRVAQGSRLRIPRNPITPI